MSPVGAADRAWHPADVPLRDGRTAHVRGLTAADAEALLVLELAVVAAGRGVPHVPGERFARSWDPTGRELALGVWLDGALVGEGNLRRGRLARVEHVAELGVAIHPAAQGMGVGRLLTCALLDWARAQTTWPLRRIELRVFASNERAIRLYESLGFQHEGRRRDCLRNADGSYEDDLVMGLLIA